jgi:hypothetical protein
MNLNSATSKRWNRGQPFCELLNNNFGMNVRRLISSSHAKLITRHTILQDQKTNTCEFSKRQISYITNANHLGNRLYNPLVSKIQASLAPEAWNIKRLQCQKCICKGTQNLQSMCTNMSLRILIEIGQF